MPELTENTQLGGQSLHRIVFPEEDVQRRVRELGEEITRTYQASDRLLLLGLLKGSFIFMADLVRAVHLPLHVDFLVASSYGSGTVSSGDVRLLYDPEASLKGRAVVLVEDIVDTGTTLDRLLPRLEARGPTSLEICTLLHKRASSPTQVPRWVGFEAPDEFLVGYGLDYAEDFRHLPYIASL
ncbi:MAG: hypoxanthine phosphoribosyltransferase [Gemmatimonadota bacterium]|nr:hypoxanthine phosphoribosyltransferase [Gemmatimonadota bacterium]MDH5760298.1 hypoxanthine phosphoribosyltransferase [Gemmatimonadota bacterium]